MSPLPDGPWPRVAHLPDPRSLFSTDEDDISKSVTQQKEGGAIKYYAKMLLRFFAEVSVFAVKV